MKIESRKTYQKDCTRSHAAYLPAISRICDIGHGKGRRGERNRFSESASACRARRKAGRFFCISFQRKRRGGPLQYETEPEERTGRAARNREGLSGRRAVGHRRRGRGDPHRDRGLSAHRAARRPSPKKVIQGGAKAAAQRGGTGRGAKKPVQVLRL